MARISIWPSPTASAVAEPDMPANSMLASTLAWPSPPRSGLTSTATKPNSRVVMPPVFISRPASRKNGIASSRKPSIWLIALRASMVATRESNRSPNRNPAPTNAPSPAANPTGMPTTIRPMTNASATPATIIPGLR
jgi:hypothetical protein